MENDILHKLWDSQKKESLTFTSQEIVSKAKKRRNAQYFSIIIMFVTVLILILYAFYYAFNEWNNFNLGLLLMIFSLSFRIVIELYTLYRKEKHLISMNQQLFDAYLKKYYKTRLFINFAITPICIATYIFGFYLLLPYFKTFFSNGFYNYILFSGIFSLGIIIGIIINSVLKEIQFLKQFYK